MTKKTIDSLISDIYGVFLNKHTISEENLEELGEAVKDAVRKGIEQASEKRKPTLRMSIIGKKDRQLWYELNQKNADVSEFGDVDLFEPNPEKYLKFLFGSVLEQLLVFFVKESGHSLTHFQEEVEIEGVLGHTDGVIDGVPIDMKSASSYQFGHKFKTGALLRGDDAFGYVGQLSGYRDRLLEKYPEEIDPETAAWLVINKESGELFLLKADAFDLIDAPARVRQLKKILASDKPPNEKCYPDQPLGSNGNRVLSKSCEYCPFKKDCWKASNGGTGLRAFKYADGIKHFTNVSNTPRVDEIPI